jgi:hypothetical protein
MDELNKIINWLSPLINEGRTLVYFASGREIKRAYIDLPYENVVLVDYCFKNRNRVYHDKVFTIGLDCVHAIDLFKILNIKIDCFVCINEGLYEGGGKYSINSDGFLGYASPVLADPFIHIGCKDYYWKNQPGQSQNMEYHHLVEHWLDIPFKSKQIITSDNKNYISPLIFPFETRFGERASVTLLKDKSSKECQFFYKDLLVRVKHKSIWLDMDQLDATFLSYENRYQQGKMEQFNSKVFSMDHLKYFTNHSATSQRNNSKHDMDDTQKIKDLNKEKVIRTIGLVPCGANYMEMIKDIAVRGKIKEIVFYHMNKNDFGSLYEMGAKKKDSHKLFTCE